MLNGIFGKWLKEFATLVLTQTVQAFLLAIVMTVIISALGNADDATTGNQAAGLLAIIALASFGKIELLVKNIFGVTSQFGDPSLSEGKRGLTAGTLLAMRGGKRLLDNGTKLVDSQRKIKEAKLGLASLNGDGTADATTSRLTGGNPVTENIEDATSNVNNPVKGANGELLETSVKLQGLDDLSRLTNAIDKLASQAEKSNGGSDKKKFEDMLKEGKDLRRSAIRENIGGFVGGTTGAIIGLAQGEDIVETTLAGAGAGDAIGQATAARKAQKIDYNNRTKKYVENIKNLSEEAYDKNIKELTKALENSGLGGISSRVGFESRNAITSSVSRNRTVHKINKNIKNSNNSNDSNVDR